MDEHWLHALRNELNVLTVGMLMLRSELQSLDRADLTEALDRLERAALRCADLLALAQQTPPAID